MKLTRDETKILPFPVVNGPTYYKDQIGPFLFDGYNLRECAIHVLLPEPYGSGHWEEHFRIQSNK